MNRDVGTRWEGTIFAILCVLRALLFSTKSSDNIISFDYVGNIINSITQSKANKVVYYNANTCFNNHIDIGSFISFTYV